MTIKMIRQNKTTWTSLDDEVCQYLRRNGNDIEIIQFVWLDTTPEDIERGCHPYVVVHGRVGLDDITDEDRELERHSLGYSDDEVDIDDDMVAVGVFVRTIGDDCVIFRTDTEEEAVRFIERYVREN